MCEFELTNETGKKIAYFPQFSGAIADNVMDRQETLFSKSGQPGQASLFSDVVIPDDFVSKHYPKQDLGK